MGFGVPVRRKPGQRICLSVWNTHFWWMTKSYSAIRSLRCMKREEIPRPSYSEALGRRSEEYLCPAFRGHRSYKTAFIRTLLEQRLAYLFDQSDKPDCHLRQPSEGKCTKKNCLYKEAKGAFDYENALTLHLGDSLSIPLPTSGINVTVMEK